MKREIKIDVSREAVFDASEANWENCRHLNNKLEVCFNDKSRINQQHSQLIEILGRLHRWD